MKERIKLWVAALRSGKYRQGQRCLRSNTGTYCCLGVACEVYMAETGKGHWRPVGVTESTYAFDAPNGSTSSNSLPETVAKWFGFTHNPVIGKTKTRYILSAIRANDDEQMDFLQIADLVEKEYLK